MSVVVWFAVIASIIVVIVVVIIIIVITVSHNRDQPPGPDPPTPPPPPPPPTPPDPDSDWKDLLYVNTISNNQVFLSAAYDRYNFNDYLNTLNMTNNDRAMTNDKAFKMMLSPILNRVFNDNFAAYTELVFGDALYCKIGDAEFVAFNSAEPNDRALPLRAFPRFSIYYRVDIATYRVSDISEDDLQTVWSNALGWIVYATAELTDELASVVPSLSSSPNIRPFITAPLGNVPGAGVAHIAIDQNTTLTQNFLGIIYPQAVIDGLNVVVSRILRGLDALLSQAIATGFVFNIGLAVFVQNSVLFSSSTYNTQQLSTLYPSAYTDLILIPPLSVSPELLTNRWINIRGTMLIQYWQEMTTQESRVVIGGIQYFTQSFSETDNVMAVGWLSTSLNPFGVYILIHTV
jgi:hypothetical protein